MKTIILFISILFTVSFSSAQEDNCSFSIEDTSFTVDVNKELRPYKLEEEWTKDDYDDLKLVYSLFCEEMFNEATTHIYKAFETQPTLHVIERIWHADNHEIWDVLLRSDSQTFHIHFKFELSEE